MVKSTAEAKKIERLRANLHMLDAPLRNKHTIFVSDESAAAAVRAERGGTPAELAARAAKRKREASGPSAEPAPEVPPPAGSGDGREVRKAAKVAAKVAAKSEKQRAARYSELEQRMERHAKMGAALQRIGVEKALQGKGKRKRIRKADGSKVFKFAPRRQK